MLIEEKTLNSIGDLETEILSIQTNYSESISRFLFRGHADSDWKLHSTLDRELPDGKLITLIDYYRLLNRIQGSVSAFSNNSWNLIGWEQYNKYLADFYHIAFEQERFWGYEFMAFLRHHGFPSPLVDWTESLHVAVYFAFRNTAINSDYTSIFVFLEQPYNEKGFSSTTPMIVKMPKYIGSHHERHYLQDCRHTVCVHQTESGIAYSPHEECLYADRDVHRQDFFWKFNLPTTIRQEVLKKLDSHRLNEYSLFHTLESWLYSKWLQQFLLLKDTKQYGIDLASDKS